MPNHITNIVQISGSKEEIDALIEKLCTEKEEEDYNGEKTGKTYLQEFDFGAIIPMPETLRITSGTATDNAIAYIKAMKKNDFSDVEKIADYHWVTEKIKNNNDYFLATEENQKKLRVALVMKHLKDGLTTKSIKEGFKAIENIEKYGCKTWHDWSRMNWGTKWNAYDIGVFRNSDETVTYTFYTAWSCPAQVLVELSNQNPNLKMHIQYADEDFGSNVGEFKLQGGVELQVTIPDSGTEQAYTMAASIMGYDENYFAENLEYMENESDLEIGWGKICLKKVYGFEPDDFFPELKPFIVEALINMAVEKEDYEYASKLKEMLPKED
jgi:cellobiose-specific phosphotransferase system component IIA